MCPPGYFPQQQCCIQVAQRQANTFSSVCLIQSLLALHPRGWAGTQPCLSSSQGTARAWLWQLSPKVLPPLCFAGGMAEMMLPPALMNFDRFRSPEI